MCNHLLNPRKYWVLKRDRRPQLTQTVTLVKDVGDPRICKSLKRWRPRRDLNPRLHRERAMPEPLVAAFVPPPQQESKWAHAPLQIRLLQLMTQRLSFVSAEP